MYVNPSTPIVGMTHPSTGILGMSHVIVHVILPLTDATVHD